MVYTYIIQFGKKIGVAYSAAREKIFAIYYVGT